MHRTAPALFALLTLAAPLAAQTAGRADSAATGRPQLSESVRAYVSVDSPVVALTNVQVVDGTHVPMTSVLA